MSHIHSVHDSSAHFKINPVTRVIECLGKEKPRIMKGDHNSERITFELPRVIDGHDMTTCNRIAVHALNIDAVTEEPNEAPPYYVDDIQPSPEDDTVALCSWLIPRSCTQLVGPLYFRVTFECISNPEVGEVDYSWNTDIYKGLAVGDGIRCGDYDPEEYNDILAQWQLIITEAAVSAAVAGAAEAQAKAEAAQLKAEEAQTGAEQAKTSAAGSAQAAADSARTAAGSADDASTHEANALNAVKQAQDAAGRAETAATNAENNLASARSAEANARQYQTEANNSAKSADASRATAEQAKADAVSAAARAEQAQAGAEQAKTSAVNSAQAAAGFAQDAATSAAEAVTKTRQALEEAKASGEFDGEPGEPGPPGKDYILTEADKAEIAEQAAALVDVPGGGVSSWEDLPAPMPAEYLPEGVAFAEKNFLLDETDAREETDPTFGRCWIIDKAPNLTAGETYTVIYNGASYDCVCYSGDDSGLSFARGAFLMGNFSVTGGANTGEPFAMVVFPTLQIISLDLSGAASVRIGIMGRENVMNVYMDTSDADNMTADKTAGEIWNAVKAGNQVLLYVRGLYICAFTCFMPGHGALFAYPGIAYSGGEIAEIKGFKGIMVREDKSVLMQS